MSKSTPITKPKRVITHNEIVKDLSERTCVSEATIRLILAELVAYIMEQLTQGNAVRIHRICTFYLRFRSYSEARRKQFHMNRASLPEFCYYPYAEFSHTFRQAIAQLKHEIHNVFNTK